jgi:hypothetical protein
MFSRTWLPAPRSNRRWIAKQRQQQAARTDKHQSTAHQRLLPGNSGGIILSDFAGCFGSRRYNPRKRNIDGKLLSMRLGWPIAMVVMVASALVGLNASEAPGHWEQPAANLVDQVAEILGPGQARLTIRNLSSIPTDEIPAIRKLLLQDLKAHGVLASGAESANTIRVTLSESANERLWVAEVVEGNETHVAMVRVEPGATQPAQAASGLALRKQTILTSKEEVLAMLETPVSLVAVEPEEIVIYSHADGGWQVQKRIRIGQKRPLPRDPRAVIVPAQGGDGFTAFLTGTACAGSYQSAQPGSEWMVHCSESDDPWMISGSATAIAVEGAATDTVALKAFYNASRDYFTGMVVPVQSADLPPFYSAALLPRPNGIGWLIEGIDGKVQIVENGVLRPVAAARDWGSDFASLHTGCGAGTQIVVSGSGAAAADSLRAFELPAQEVIPASAPLTMDGTVTALWTAPDGKSVFVVVRDAGDRYEVDRVTALCN